MGLMPSKLKAGGSRQGCLHGAPCGAGHLPGRAKLVACAFIQGHKPVKWTGEEVEEEEGPSQKNKTCTLIWRRQWHPTPVLLPGKSHGWRSLVGFSPWGR